jgi:hypothetical protein
MRVLPSVLSALALVSLAILYSCGDDVPPSLSLQQKAAKILDEGSPWGGTGNVEVLSSPTGVDPSELSGLQIDFSTSGPDDWAPTFFESSGADDFISTSNSTWIWTGSGTDNITLSEASVAELTSVDVTDESVTFSFEINSNSGGRITGFDGSYRVKLQ